MTFPRLPQHAFRHLRSIEWVFPAYDGTPSYPDQNELRDWLDTIDLIAHTANVSRLSITIDMASNVRELCYVYVPGVLNDTSEATVWGVYRRIIEPMIVLEGLQDLFVHLGWPLVPRKHDLRDQQERILERRVMGKHYDSTARGKVSTSSREA